MKLYVNAIFRKYDMHVKIVFILNQIIRLLYVLNKLYKFCSRQLIKMYWLSGMLEDVCN